MRDPSHLACPKYRLAYVAGLDVLYLAQRILKEYRYVPAYLVKLRLVLLTIVEIVAYCICLIPLRIALIARVLNGIIHNELLQRVQHQVIEAVLPMIEGGQREDGLGILRKGPLAQAETGDEAGIQEAEDDQHVECELNLFS